MASQGILYTVKGPRGSYYAIHDPASRRVWTERTEQAARAQAGDMDIALVSDEIISHEELLRRTGRELPRIAPPAAAQKADTPQPPKAVVISRVLTEKRDEALIFGAGGAVTNPSIFASQPVPGRDDQDEAGARQPGAFSSGKIISNGRPSIPIDDGNDLGTSSL
jgi:hypothetical protein